MAQVEDLSKHREENRSGHGAIEGTPLPRVKPGIYDLMFKGYETQKLFGGRSLKLVLWFTITTQGQHFETVIPRYYNVTRIKGAPRKNGDFTVGRGSNFLREYVTFFGMPKRTDRISMEVFKNKIISGKVKTVTNGFAQSKIPAELQYSVISELVGVRDL